MQYPKLVTSFLLYPYIILSTLYSQNLNLCSYPREETTFHNDTKQHYKLLVHVTITVFQPYGTESYFRS